MTEHRTISISTNAREIGMTGAHENRIRLPREPWHQEPELKPEPVRDDRSIYGTTIRTPEVARPRVPSPDRFSAWDQDALAAAWSASAAAEGHMKGIPGRNLVPTEYPLTGGSAAVLTHLATKTGDTFDIAREQCQAHSVISSAVYNLRKRGYIKTVSPLGYRPAIYAITPAGKARLERG